MTRRGRYLMWGGMVLAVTTMATMIAPLTTQGATRFANAAFETQWQSLERTIPNFYGPLSTAFDPSSEPYVEGIYNGQSGVRVVQYFDKARLEQITPERRITSGLLTVELKSGNLQLGNNTFAQYAPAYIGVAGDPGGGGPTYADLQQLPERVMQASGSVNLRFEPTSNTFAANTALSDPQAAFAEYISDPNGRFGQNIPRAFSDFLRRIPGGSLTAMGYPIGPAFTANVRLKGVNNTAVIVQPFQRRVLTYTPSNREATRVEFGNIGRHYLQWRSSLGTPGTAGPTISPPIFPPFPPLTPPVFVTNTPGPTATSTPGGVSSEDATVTAVVIIATNAAASATAAQNLGTATSVAAAATGTSQTATAGAREATAASNSGTQTAVAVAATGTSLTATAVIVDATAAAQTATSAFTTQTAVAGMQTTFAGTQNAIGILTAAPATATQISLEQTGAAIAYATQTSVAATQRLVASGTPASQGVQQQAFKPQRTPAASARA